MAALKSYGQQAAALGRCLGDCHSAAGVFEHHWIQRIPRRQKDAILESISAMGPNSLVIYQPLPTPVSFMFRIYHHLKCCCNALAPIFFFGASGLWQPRLHQHLFQMLFEPQLGLSYVSDFIGNASTIYAHFASF